MKRFSLIIFLIALIGVLICINIFMNKPAEKKISTEVTLSDTARQELSATFECGRVVEILTTRGEIEMLFFERDTPKTSALILSYFNQGRYNNLKFSRVEKDLLIQIDEIKSEKDTLPLEIRKGLDNVKGAVGMARLPDDKNSATNAFYILIEPMRHLDGDYTVFARVISGMDVVMKITSQDKIVSTSLRESNKEDKARLDELRTIEAERETE